MSSSRHFQEHEMGSISFEALSSKALNNVHHLSYLEKTALKAISEEVDLPSGVQTSDLMHLANYLNEVFMANIQEADKKSENDLVELINFLLFATDWKKGSSDQSDGMSTGQNVECACDCGCNLLLQNNTEDLDPEQLTLYSTDTDGIGVGNEKTGAQTLAATLKIPNSDLLVQIPSDRYDSSNDSS